MQTIIIIHCNKGPSVRERISKDPRLEEYDLRKVRDLQPGRAPGWLKLASTIPGRAGVLNIEWQANSQFLKCRVVNRGSGRPDRIVGDFLGYLLARHTRRIAFITVVPE